MIMSVQCAEEALPDHGSYQNHSQNTSCEIICAIITRRTMTKKVTATRITASLTLSPFARLPARHIGGERPNNGCMKQPRKENASRTTSRTRPLIDPACVYSVVMSTAAAKNQAN